MRIATLASLAAVVTGLAACGGAPLPSEQAKLQGPPVLAPLATGARWTYRITDPVKGVFDKQVVVVGPGVIPDSTATAVEVRDTEPTSEETSWMNVESGFLVRHREEDRRAGTLVRVTTWDPGAPKDLAVEANTGWTGQIQVTEREWHPDGTVSTKQPVYQFTVVATGVSVTVPAGTYTCVQVVRERLDKADRRTFWLAPNVGKVREESDRIEELSSYVPGT
jgi:hypothetical protein